MSSKYDEEFNKVRKGICNAMHEKMDNMREEKKGVKMIPTEINSLNFCCRSEQLMVGVDMGGSNLRISQIQVLPEKAKIVNSKEFSIPQEAKTEFIFQWAAEKIHQFFLALKINSIKEIGFTFSFPFSQLSINQGRVKFYSPINTYVGVLLQWNKSFEAPTIVGKDVARLLEEECKKLGLHFKVVYYLLIYVGVHCG